MRESEGRNPDPSGAVIDGQAVKGSGVGGPERGYDGAKRLSGRKRRLLVGTNALILGARVHAASLHDRDGGQRLLDDTSPSRSAAVAPRAGGETTRLAGAAEEVGRGEDFRVLGA